MARSPWAWTARCIAVGATAIGEANDSPSRDVRRSASVTPRSTRGRNRTACHCDVASAAVTPSRAPLST